MERGKEIWGEDRKKAYRKEHGEEDGSFLMTVPSEVVTRSLSLLEPQSEANRTQCKY